MASTTTKNGTSKYTETVGKATGAAGASDATGGDPEGQLAPLSKEAGLMFSTPSDEQIQAMLNDPSLEFAPQLKKLAEGELVTGLLEGMGPVVELTRMDRQTKEETTSLVNTWILAGPNGGARVSILSSVQLDKKLPPFIGGIVSILRGKEVNTQNGNRVTEYMVSGPKKANGERRSWVRPQVIDAVSVEGGKAAPQLAAPSAAAGGEDHASA
jgi:hypothetical protein